MFPYLAPKTALAILRMRVILASQSTTNDFDSVIVVFASQVHLVSIELAAQALV